MAREISNSGKPTNILLIPNKVILNHGLVIGKKTKYKSKTVFYIHKIADRVQENETCLGNCDGNILSLHKDYENVEFNLHNAIPLRASSNHNQPCTAIFYDSKVYQHSESIDVTDGYFKYLHSSLISYKMPAVSKSKAPNYARVLANQYLLKIFLFIHKVLNKSHWFAHLETNVKQICETKNQISRWNLFSSKVFDFVLGVFTLYLIVQHKLIVMDSLLKSTQFIIDGLKHVLNELMDSPAGLKLNYALNQTLGIFFFYHISLWRAFIQSILNVSPNIVYVFAILGACGLSYQIQLCADLLTFLTFHVYCIYVYAARFYRLQIYTIGSLWRLFIGRKHNPLRQRVDSYQYSHNQLFIGTLGFTVLIFLFPTTFLYYIVFTMFRVCVLIVCKILSYLASVLCSLPIYLSFLRMVNASSIKGSVRIHIKKNIADSTLEIHTTLDVLETWFKHMRICEPKNKAQENNVNSFKMSNIFVGKLL